MKNDEEARKAIAGVYCQLGQYDKALEVLKPIIDKAERECETHNMKKKREPNSNDWAGAHYEFHSVDLWLNAIIIACVLVPLALLIWV